MVHYTFKELEKFARDTVKQDGKAAGIKVRYLDCHLELTSCADAGVDADVVVLVARGARVADGYEFEVRARI